MELTMTTRFCGFLSCCILFAAITPFAAIADEKDDAIKKDHKLIEGIWRVTSLDVNGDKAKDEDARKLSVINGTDGAWNLRSEGTDLVKGTSTIDPTQNPKTIDFTPTDGDDKGKVFLGIYELGESTRKLCFAPVGSPRPTEFTSLPGSQRVLVAFERDKEDAIARDRRRIEGTWIAMALEINGNKAMEADARKLKVVIGADGSWNVASEGNEVSQGTSVINPLATPKSIDFTTTVGNDKGKLSLGIYEIGEGTLKFCVAPSEKPRPTEFTSTLGNEQILLTFERENGK
jgi:uncharacterized protein (TIGR03067 family)